MYITLNTKRHYVSIVTKGTLRRSHGKQEISSSISEAIFFAISLLQFFKIKFGKFRGLLIFQIDCIESPTTTSARNYNF